MFLPLVVGQRVKTVDRQWEGTVVTVNAPGDYNVGVLYYMVDDPVGFVVTQWGAVVSVGWVVVPYKKDGTVAPGYPQSKNLNDEDKRNV